VAKTASPTCLRHREHGGRNELLNLAELCVFHHRLVHEGRWTLFRDDQDQWVAFDPNGEILAAPAAPRGDAGGIVQSNGARGAAITSATVVSRWAGEPLHVNEVIAASWSVEHRRN
jgi:hypothetical protein